MGSTDEDDDDDDERHPLCVACVAGRLQKVDSLLAAGEDPNVVGSQRTTPLFIACERECPELVAMLLAARADPDLPAFGGATPLFIASTRNQASIAGLLVDANAQLDFVGDNDYYTPLLACTKRGSDDVAKVRRPPRPAPPGPGEAGVSTAHRALPYRCGLTRCFCSAARRCTCAPTSGARCCTARPPRAT